MSPLDQPATPSSKKVLRSPNFPSIPLREAVEKARVVWDKEKKHPVLDTVLYGHWEYAPKSSGARSTLSALLKYGLLVEVETAGGREVKLSDAALQILLGEPEQKATALRTAALAPKLYNDLWQKYGNSLPSEESLKGKLIIESGFNPDSVPGFIADYKDTIEFAGLTAEAKGSTSDAAQDSQEEATDGKTAEPVKAVVVKQPESPLRRSPATTPNMLANYTIPLGANEAQLTFTGKTLELEDFDALIEYVELFKKQFERKAKVSVTESAVATDTQDAT